MTLLRWVRTFSRSVARKRRDRSSGDRTIVVSQVRPGLLTTIQTFQPSDLTSDPTPDPTPDRAAARGRAANRRTTASEAAVPSIPSAANLRRVPNHREARTGETARIRNGSMEPVRSSGGATAVQDAPFPIAGGVIQRTADVPNEVQAEIEHASLLRTIQRLETPLRGLYAVTARKTGACSSEEMYMLFRIWRQALGDYLQLEPDERAVLTYGPHVDESYFVRGSREPGARVAVLEPCWTLRGKVALRGEAQVIEDGA